MTRKQILAVAKPILFNTEMVQALLDDRKHVTRRVVKQTVVDKFVLSEDNRLLGSFDACHPEWGVYPTVDDAPYQPGDLLYVRETWMPETEQGIPTGGYIYKASDKPVPDGDAPLRWHPSIHMPKKAARIFLRVTDVWVEKLQNITEEQAKAEGANWKNGKNVGWEEKMRRSAIDRFAEIWNACYASPRPAFEHGVITHYESYPWEDIHETRTHNGLPWHVCGNPWVWATEFERMAAE